MGVIIMWIERRIRYRDNEWVHKVAKGNWT